MQNNATHYNTLKPVYPCAKQYRNHVALLGPNNVNLPRIMHIFAEVCFTRCNALQRTATHCNTLQHDERPNNTICCESCTSLMKYIVRCPITSLPVAVSQPVPEKMELRMKIGMEIRILNGLLSDG